jgi:GNAT superfamily N-acetyltransferase
MRVVRATEHDIYAVAVITKKGMEESTSHVKVDVDYTTKIYQEIIRKNSGAMFLLKDDKKLVGALGCVKRNDLHNGDLIAIETVWYVHPEYRGGGLKLLNAFDRWAKEEGCKKKAMIHLEDSLPDKLKKIYEKKGYQLVESHYMAVVT